MAERRIWLAGWLPLRVVTILTYSVTIIDGSRSLHTPQLPLTSSFPWS